MYGPRWAELLLLLLLLGAVRRDAEWFANKIGPRGQCVRGVLVVEAVCPAGINAAILGLGNWSKQ